MPYDPSARWPTRTGLTTAKRLARALSAILSKYAEVYQTILTEEQVTLVNAVVAACDAFVANVPQYDPTP